MCIYGMKFSLNFQLKENYNMMYIWNEVFIEFPAKSKLWYDVYIEWSFHWMSS